MVAQLKRNFQILDSQVSRSTKTKNMRIYNPSPTIKSLPQDLLIEVLAKVAFSSFTDLFNAKLIAKDFLQASEDASIFRRVSFQNSQKASWKNPTKFASFMKRCSDNENPKALYIKGMLEFFACCNEASGLASLKASAEIGHLEACYVYGVVLYSSSKRLKSQEGLEFLKRCEGNMTKCRQRVKSFVRGIWVKNKISSPENDFDRRQSYDCVSNNNCKKYNERRNGWDWNDEDDHYGAHTCEPCKWNGEVLRFCNMLRCGSYN